MGHDKIIIVTPFSFSELNATLGCSMDRVMLAIDKRVHEFFIRSLQPDVFTMRLEYE